MVPETTPFTEEQQEYLNDVKPVLANVGKEIFKNFLWISAIISPLLIYDVFPKVQPQKLNTWMGKLYFRKICKHIHEIGLRSSDNLTYFVKNTENLAKKHVFSSKSTFFCEKIALNAVFWSFWVIFPKTYDALRAENAISAENSTSAETLYAQEML